MTSNKIDAKMLSKMFLAGANNLESHKEWINELNVFPVPDGDTGTNMTMTIMSAAREVAALGDEPEMLTLCKAISSGSLRGARGNSGVILSQLLRGFTKSVSDKQELTIEVLADAFEKGVETAYKAVMKPKEGTILTVARGGAEKARELCDEGITDMEQFLKQTIEHAEYVLSQTPEMLPVLKQAGVVDSGGQGLIQVVKGAFDAFLGKEIDYSSIKPAEVKPIASNMVSSSYTAQAEMEIKFGYCTEFIILLSKTFNIKHELDFKAYLESIGDSVVCVADDDVVKVHVHTNDPGLAIQKALQYGQLSNLKIDNMRLEHQEKLFKMSEKEDAAQASNAAPKEPAKPVGFLAVSVGEGVNEIFKSLGVDYIIEGGQTMNPSTADILDAVDQVNAENIFILPNNKNIILAANQAASLSDDKIIKQLDLTTIGGEIIIDSKNNIAYVTSQNAQSIYIVDLNSMQLKKVVKLDQKPSKIAYCEIDDSISFYDEYSSKVFNMTKGVDNFVVQPVGNVSNVSKVLSDVANIYTISRTNNELQIFDKVHGKILNTLT